MAELGKLFHAAPSPLWSESVSKDDITSEDEEDLLSRQQRSDSPVIAVADQLQAMQGSNNSCNGSDTSIMTTKQRGRGSIARRTARGNNSLGGAPPLCLQLDLQSLSALSLSSPQSARFKSPEIVPSPIVAPRRFSDLGDNSQKQTENEGANEGRNVVDGSPIDQPRSGRSASERATGDQTR